MPQRNETDLFPSENTVASAGALIAAARAKDSWIADHLVRLDT